MSDRRRRRLGISVVELGKLAYRNQLGRVRYGIYRSSSFRRQLDPYMLPPVAGGRGVLSHDTVFEL